MIAVALLLAAQILPAPDSVPVWEAFQEDAESRNFFDPASIRRDGAVARVVIRSVMHRATAGFKTVMIRARIDCRRRAIGIEATDGYGEDGRLIRSAEPPPSAIAMTPVGNVPTYARLVERACGR